MTDHAQEARDIYRDWDTNRTFPADAYEVLMAGWLAAQVAIEERLGQIADALAASSAVTLSAAEAGIQAPDGKPVGGTVTITPERKRYVCGALSDQKLGVTWRCQQPDGHDGPHSWEPKRKRPDLDDENDDG